MVDKNISFFNIKPVLDTPEAKEWMLNVACLIQMTSRNTPFFKASTMLQTPEAREWILAVANRIRPSPDCFSLASDNFTRFEKGLTRTLSGLLIEHVAGELEALNKKAEQYLEQVIIEALKDHPLGPHTLSLAWRKQDEEAQETTQGEENE